MENNDNIKTKKPIYKKWWFIVLAIFFGFIILGQILILTESESDKIIRLANEKTQDSLDSIEERTELLKKQFNAWDGSHINLEKYIKDNRNDPDSYEHIETKYIDNKDYLSIITKFRGANAFGGKVINSVVAKVDLEGNIIEVVNTSK